MSDSISWKKLFDAVRADCLVGLWSKGCALAREGKVAGEARDGDEWTFRVRSMGSAVAPTIRLYPEDAEWDCDCGSRFDPCEHVAASVIAAADTAQEPATLFEGERRAACIRYVLDPIDDGVVVRRYLPSPDGEYRLLEVPLANLIAKGGGEISVSPTHQDLQIDRLIGRAVGSALPVDRVTTLLRALVGAGDVRVGEDAVSASAEPLFPQAYVTDAGADGVELVVQPDPSIDRIVAAGILRRGDTLHPFGAQARFGQTWERLPFRRVFAKREIAELVSSALPELSKHITVDIRTARMPEKQGRVAVWIQFNVDLIDDGIDVCPLLVYGDPPVARIDSGRLVHLAGAVPVRDEARETTLRLQLRERLNLVPGRRVHMTGSDAAKLLSDLESFDGGRPVSARSPATAMTSGVTLEARVERSGDDFDVVFYADGIRADAGAVMSAWRNGIGLVPLPDGSFARLPADWLGEHGHLVADLLAARRLNDGATPKAALPLLGALCDVLDAPEPPELAGLRRLLTDIPTDAERHARPAAEIAEELCSDFRGELRGYQADGIAWLARLRDAGLGAILADDMGLGKTIQALCILQARSLVVCPRSVIHNWAGELERFRPALGVSLYHGPRRRLDDDADVTLTTYATLRNDADLLCEQPWDVVVLDESQTIKNPDSQVARTAYRLRSQFRLSLSGTPIENRLTELWSQMHFVNRGLLGGRKDFARNYEEPIAAENRVVLERLRSRIKPFLLRRLKKEVAAELPPRTETVLHCELDDDERAAYDSVRAASRQDVVRQLSGADGGVLKALEALLRLRQAACHSGLLPGREAPSSSKVEALCEALEDAVADGHKALVFSQWTALLDKVEPQLAERALSFVRLDGSTRDRAGVVEEFQSEDGPPVMLISLKAGGTGLNLTAADHVFLLDPWWNPAVEDQAADRAHRIGQDRPVMIYRMVAKDTVEERVLALQARKRELADAALSGAAAGAAALTREDILALLE